MNRRPLLFMAITTVVVAAYLVSVVSEDTLPNAASRFGKAVLANDTAAIWKFVPEDERTYYGLDQQKFEAYWTTIVKPHLGGINSFHLYNSPSLGLRVICEPVGARDISPRFTMLVTGQKGKYYAPFIIACSCINAAGLDLKSTKVSKNDRFGHYAEWIKSNKSQLDALGISVLRRGPKFGGETLGALKNHFEEIAASDRVRTKLATR